MTVLLLGASGATGRLLVQQLLDRGREVRAIVRSPETLPESIRHREGLSLIRGTVLDLGEAELARHVQGCAAVASYLGHNLSLKGIYGSPRRLVTDTARRLCCAIDARKHGRPLRFVLMNTAGNSNRDLPETISFAQRGVIGLIRALLPPHADNERAADYLRVDIGGNHETIEWVVVRPNILFDESDVSAYEVFPSPTRSAIFDPGRSSRINVAHFMADLITDDDLWRTWRGRMPVLYNRAVS